jgi:hypothetical protein
LKLVAKFSRTERSAPHDTIHDRHPEQESAKQARKARIAESSRRTLWLLFAVAVAVVVAITRLPSYPCQSVQIRG